MSRLKGSTTRAQTGPYFCEGARLLWQVLRERFAGDIDALAAEAKVEESAVRRHLYGDRQPEGTVAAVYERTFGVGAALWYDTPPTKPLRLPAMLALLALLRDTLAAAPEGRRTPALRAVLQDRCATCKVDPDVVLAYASTDKIAKKVGGTNLWKLVPPPPAVTWPLSVTRLLSDQRATLEKMLGDHSSIQPHDLGNRLRIGYPEASAMLRELAVAGLVTLKRLVYHRGCSSAPVDTVADGAAIPDGWACSECGGIDDEPTPADEVSYGLVAIPVRAPAAAPESAEASS